MQRHNPNPKHKRNVPAQLDPLPTQIRDRAAQLRDELDAITINSSLVIPSLLPPTNNRIVQSLSKKKKVRRTNSPVTSSVPPVDNYIHGADEKNNLTSSINNDVFVDGVIVYPGNMINQISNISDISGISDEHGRIQPYPFTDTCCNSPAELDEYVSASDTKATPATKAAPVANTAPAANTAPVSNTVPATNTTKTHKLMHYAPLPTNKELENIDENVSGNMRQLMLGLKARGLFNDSNAEMEDKSPKTEIGDKENIENQPGKFLLNEMQVKKFTTPTPPNSPRGNPSSTFTKSN